MPTLPLFPLFNIQKGRSYPSYGIRLPRRSTILSFLLPGGDPPSVSCKNHIRSRYIPDTAKGKTNDCALQSKETACFFRRVRLNESPAAFWRCIPLFPYRAAPFYAHRIPYRRLVCQTIVRYDFGNFSSPHFGYFRRRRYSTQNTAFAAVSPFSFSAKRAYPCGIFRR